VAVVAASPLVRAGLHAGLQQAGLDVTATAVSLRDLATVATQAVFDVVVLEAAEAEVHTSLDGWPPMVLLVDAADEEAASSHWLAEGVTVVPHHAPAAQVAAAANAAAAGLVASTRELMAQSLRLALLPPARSGPPHEPLTARETQVLEKLALGLGNKAIAQALHISTHTAKFHVAQIIAKLDATSRAHAVAKALRAGLLEA
jgi:DNA-binding NarL/FixJ family response regulator